MSYWDARIYFFACDFLACVFQVFYNLDEEVGEHGLGDVPLRNSDAFHKALDWAYAGRSSPFDREEITGPERDMLYAAADELGGLLMFHQGTELEKAAMSVRNIHPQLSLPQYLYYLYCRFLQRVLSELDQVMTSDLSPSFNIEEYADNIDLFRDLTAELEGERPFVEPTSGPAPGHTKPSSYCAAGGRVTFGWR